MTDNSRTVAPPRSSPEQVATHEPEHLITFRVSVLAQLLSRTIDASVREDLDLTSRQWRVLVVLNRLGSATSGDVARMANFDQSQVSRVAQELMKKELLIQAPDAIDRRKQILTLTPAALECLARGIPASLERERRLRQRLSETEYASFCRALEVLGDEAHTILAERASRAAR